ncbi:hydrolase [Streptomyces sp. So13.3]|uniref:HAD family acid phosphatase n=1 Tax=Streptomyces TaxID=1883 RepID=UPI001105D9FF|nr:MULTISPECIES: HAD family acid phosphatase [Streptomyces]MCZ4095247.1 hydrolase [Streptomyces sp. H39-C1]QNA70984.1 hydrolase [Streptomyces sp. So13.3]
MKGSSCERGAERSPSCSENPETLIYARKWRIYSSAAGALLAFVITAPEATAASTTPAPAARQSSRSAALLADVDYQTWQHDVAAAAALLRPYIEQRTANASGQKLAVVLDIDNTSLETYFHDVWEFPTPATKPVLDAARYAKSRGAAIFFITARPGILHSLTEYNLKKTGYPVDGLYAQDLPDFFDKVSKYKTAKRTEIEARGYTIIANIGNNTSDLVGGHAEKTFKLPDYNGELS